MVTCVCCYSVSIQARVCRSGSARSGSVTVCTGTKHICVVCLKPASGCSSSEPAQRVRQGNRPADSGARCAVRCANHEHNQVCCMAGWEGCVHAVITAQFRWRSWRGDVSVLYNIFGAAVCSMRLCVACCQAQRVLGTPVAPAAMCTTILRRLLVVAAATAFRMGCAGSRWGVLCCHFCTPAVQVLMPLDRLLFGYVLIQLLHTRVQF